MTFDVKKNLTGEIMGYLYLSINKTIKLLILHIRLMILPQPRQISAKHNLSSIDLINQHESHTVLTVIL